MGNKRFGPIVGSVSLEVGGLIGAVSLEVGELEDPSHYRFGLIRGWGIRGSVPLLVWSHVKVRSHYRFFGLIRGWGLGIIEVRSCSAQTVTRIGLLEEIPRSGVQIPCLS